MQASFTISDLEVIAHEAPHKCLRCSADLPRVSRSKAEENHTRMVQQLVASECKAVILWLLIFSCEALVSMMFVAR